MRRFTWLLASGWLGMVAWAAGPAPVTVEIEGRKAHPTRILARFKNPRQAVAPSTLATLKDVGLTVRRRVPLVPGGVVLELDRPLALQSNGEPDVEAQAARLQARLAVLRASGVFAYAHPDWWVHPALTEPADAAYREGTLWGLRNTGQFGGMVGADVLTNPDNSDENAWDTTVGSTNVIVAVIDTGIRYTHQDLFRQMWRNPDEIPGNGVDDDRNGYVDDVFGVNVITGSGDPMDREGHGTHVAGTIGAEANNGKPMVGVAWKVRLMAVKFLDVYGGFTADAVEGINYAVDKGAKILNNSWGGEGGVNPDDDALLRDTIIGASTNGVLFVAAAGNDTNDVDAVPFYPAAFDVENIITVAALNRKDELAFFSNYGATTVDIGAPGAEIYSCWSGSDLDYLVADGTSMAAPHVSGVAALIWAAFPDAPMAEVRERILSSAVPVPDLRNITVTGGRVNAYRALQASHDGELEVTIDPRNHSEALISSNLPVFVTVNDLFPVTNATVWAEIQGTTNVIDFLNDGTLPDVISNDNVYSAFFDTTPYTQPPFSNVVQFLLNVTAPDKNPYTNLITYTLVAPPPNDNFDQPAKIPGPGAFGRNIATLDNRYATLEENEPWPAGNSNAVRSVWYAWSPAFTSTAIVDTAGSSFDTVLAVYVGPSLVNLTNIAAADNMEDGREQAYVRFLATRGTTYRIQVAGADPEAYGNLRLRVEPNGQPDFKAPLARIASPVDGALFTTDQIEVQGYAFDPEPNASGVREVLIRVNGSLPVTVKGLTNWTAQATLDPGLNDIAIYARDWSDNVSPETHVKVQYAPNEPANDVFGTVLSPSSPFYLKGVSGQVEAKNETATKEYGEPLHGGNEGGHSVWWTFKAPESGVLKLDTEDSDFDTLLGLYVGDRVRDLTTIAENDDARPDVRYSKLSHAVQGGVEYRIAVDGYGGDFGQITLNYLFTPANTHTVTLSSTDGGATVPASGVFDMEDGAVLRVAAEPEEGFVFTGWRGSVAVPPNNPLSLVVREDVTLEAVFAPRYFSDDFETGDFSKLPWRFDGDLPWEITDEVAGAGVWSARSGAIGDDQSSILRLEADFREGIGSFLLRVSSETDWDFFKFLVDGKEVDRFSGEVDWFQYEFPVAAGHHVMEWRYLKDARDKDGLDAAFIDNVDLPLEVAPDPNQPPLLSIRRLFDGQLEVSLKGQTNQVYVIQGADSPAGRWKSLSTNEATQGWIRYVDPEALRETLRFYRARTQ